MFLLRPQHREAFRQAARESFQERMASRLRQDYSEQTSALSEHALLQTIRRLVSVGEVYGFQTERDLTAFLLASFLLGEGFESENEWADRILQNEILSPDEKAQELLAEAQRRRCHPR